MTSCLCATISPYVSLSANLNGRSTCLRLTLICISIGLLSCTILQAQPINNKSLDISHPSPNAAALGEYVDVPVSYFTGVPRIGVPLHTVQSGPLSVPISLSYHAGGTRMAEMASWVGLGWTLRAGGMITRTIQGIPDEDPYGGYYYHGHKLGTNLNGKDIVKISSGIKDGEADLFSFNFNGYSGKFYIDQDRNGRPSVQLIPKQDIQVEVDVEPSNFIGFTIIVQDGTRYYFGSDPYSEAIAYEESKASGEIRYQKTSWQLMKVVSYDGLYSIDFEYKFETYSYKNPATCRLIYSECNSLTGTAAGGSISCGTTTGYDANHFYSSTHIRAARLHKITTSTSTEQVEFHAKTGRIDLDRNIDSGLNTAKRLDFISVVLGNDEKCIRHDLSYDHYIDNSSSTIAQRSEAKRLRLLSIRKASCDEEAVVPATTFTYHEPTDKPANFLPHRLSKAVDHWGYYNGVHTNDNYRLNIPTTSGYSRDSIRYEYTSKVDRQSNTKYLRYGSLEKIEYPTGGYTKYVYSGHSYMGLAPSTIRSIHNLKTVDGSPYQEAACSTNIVRSDQPIQFSKSDILEGKCKLGIVRADAPSISCRNAPSISAVVRAFQVTNGRLKPFGISHRVSLPSGQSDRTESFNLKAIGSFHPDDKYVFEVESQDGLGAFDISSPLQVIKQLTAGGLRVSKIVQHDGIGASSDIVTKYVYTKAGNSAVSSGTLTYEPKYSHFIQKGVAYSGSTRRGLASQNVWKYFITSLTFSEQEHCAAKQLSGSLHRL